MPGAQGRFAYSCLTERTDGSVDLLWEGEGDASIFTHFEMAQIAPGAEVSNKRAVSVPLYGSVKMKVAASFSGFGGVDGSIAKIKLDKNDDGTATLTIEGLKEGVVAFTDAASGTSTWSRSPPRRWRKWRSSRERRCSSLFPPVRSSASPTPRWRESR
ncbi:hypothetical protein [Collinsella intestinalis]|uniref:hypothetical protein n=1 Tax=Collinsella intestinalis TaxID=147207 RepID=UPI0015FC8A23|nr:hypothetical protein [Collinsella intestinalis]